MNNKERGEKIRTQILRDVIHHPKDLVSHISGVFSITRQAVSSHIRKLESESRIKSIGSGKGKSYKLGEVRENLLSFELIDGLEEDRIWRNHFDWVLDGIQKNVFDICYYGFTEMVNNAIDHSTGKEVTISVKRGLKDIQIIITDNGEGIFKHIKRLCNLEDERESIFELSKGKLTTDPENHSGEGIFFTSRAFDKYAIISFDLLFTHNNELPDDYLITTDWGKEGTYVLMSISKNSERDLEDVFKQYTTGPDDFGFDKTVVPLQLATFGGSLVSRSQAKRVVSGLEKFNRVIFDFEGVDSIGQAFADEIFRVYASRNPEKTLDTYRMSKEVEFMVNRAKANVK